jgi:hypothetical protein
MKNVFFLIGLLPLLLFAQHSSYERDKNIIEGFFREALIQKTAYEDLRYLCKKIGHRLSGSVGADKAVKWTSQRLKEHGADTVWLQEVMVPNWKRGNKEIAKIVNGKNLTICALGNSVPTPFEGITAEVIEVFRIEQLDSLGREKIQGKIVFFNRPMDPTFINTFRAYGGCVDQRSSGASEASKYGALGVLVRSMTLSLDNYPHTGSVNYQSFSKPIPAAAISTLDANYLSEQLKKNPKLQVFWKQECKMLPDTLSHNVIAEIKGAEFPEEIILVGGHLDSWDKGEGAHDDGAGCVQAMEVIYLFKKLGIKPKRTIRCVLFMNEENGMKGALKYEEEATKNKEKHIACIESDRGGFTPKGFQIEGGYSNEEIIRKWYKLLEPYDLYKIVQGYGGVDISPFRKHKDVLLIGLEPDSQRYFDYHHADTDVFEAIHPRELELGAASLATLVYLLSEYGTNLR